MRLHEAGFSVEGEREDSSDSLEGVLLPPELITANSARSHGKVDFNK